MNGDLLEGDERHRKMGIDFSGMDENARRLVKNGYKDYEFTGEGVQVLQDAGGKV